MTSMPGLKNPERPEISHILKGSATIVKSLPMNGTLIRAYHSLTGAAKEAAISLVTRHRRHIVTFAFLLVANFSAAILGWVTQIKIANTLGKELFGQFAFGMGIGIFGQIFVRIGLDRTLVRDLVHFPDRFGEFVHASLFLRYILGAVVFLVLLLLKYFATNLTFNWGVLLIAMSTTLFSLDLQPVYDVWNKTQRHTVYYLIQKGCYFAIIWGMIIFFQEFFSVFWIGATLSISILIYLHLQHRWAMRTLDEVPGGIHKMARNILWLFRQNWLIWIATILGFGIGLFSQLMIKPYCGFAELGAYAAAWQFQMIGYLLLNQVSRIGRPAIAKATRPQITLCEQRNFLGLYMGLMMAVVLPLVLLMIFFPKLLFSLLFKPEYHSAIPALPLLGMYVILLALEFPITQYILCIRREKIYFASIILGGILSIILCPVLIPRYGSLGAARTLLIAHGSAIFLCVGFVVWKLSRTFRDSPQ